MKTALKPKSLPWLARRAGLSDQAIDALWNKALAVAGMESGQAAEPRRQAVAMHYLLPMLGIRSGQQANGTGTGASAGASFPARVAACQ